YDLLVLWVLAVIFLSRQRWLQSVRPGDHSPFELSAAARSWIAPFVARLPLPAWILGATVLLLLMACYRSMQLIAVAAIIVGLVAIELRVAGEGEIRGRVGGLGLLRSCMTSSLTVM